MRRGTFVRIVAAGTWLWLTLSPPGAALASATSFDRETVLRNTGDLLWDRGRQPEPTPPPARATLRRQRPNTISLGIQGQFGVVRGNSRVADGFDQGPGYAFRFRYMLSPSAALGFSFEHQRYNSIQEPIETPGQFADSHVVITTVSAEGVFYVHREREFVPYFLGGFGFATPDVVFAEDQASRTNEGLFLVAGVGFERFMRPRISIDASIRGHALVSNSEFTSMGEVSLGIHLYPGD